MISWSYYLWRYFPLEYGGLYWSFLCIFLCSHRFGWWVLWGYTCYVGSLKDGLTNVWLECDYVLVCVAYTVRTNVPGCFVINEILFLITVGKSGLGLLIFFVKEMRVLISWLIYDFFHRESFYYYNRLPSSMFLEFFMNRYSLSTCYFC